MKIIECVPNFSEGRRTEVIDAISKSIEKTEGCSLLFVDSGKSSNRTVYTFVGDSADVVNGALNAAKCAYQLIDMKEHKGEHPRFGAMDVCPFTPVKNATMEDCVECANDLAKKLADELSVPIYLYGAAATSEKRRMLSHIRAGEYEHLPTKLQQAEWKPDYGPDEFVARWGATAVGARKFLIAYNVNLIATKEQAHKIALNVRESGRGPKNPGRLKCVQAIGWSLEEHNLVQVSANITDTDVTKIHQVFEEVCKDARKLRLPVLGSEIIGLVPLQTLLEAAEFYIDKEDLFILDEASKIQLVIHKLGLSQIKKFEPGSRIIEYIIEKDTSLTSLSVAKYVSAIASRTATPGGGSVAAAVAAMGAALCAMVGQMTYGKKKWENLDQIMRKNIPIVHECMTDLVPFIDLDANAFDSYMKALKIDETIEGVERKEEALQDGILKAIDIPMRVMGVASKSWQAVKELAAHGNIQCISDIQVGAKCLENGIWGAHQNVLVNLPEVKNESLREELRVKSESIAQEAKSKCEEILDLLSERKK